MAGPDVVCSQFVPATRKPASVYPAPTGHRQRWTLPTSLLPIRSFQWTRKNRHMASINGTIKRLVADKGFGFILAGDGNEYFFHNSACSEMRFDDLREGQAV